MSSRVKRIAVSSAVLLVSGAAWAGTGLNGYGVSGSLSMAGCTPGPSSSNGNPDFIDTANPSVVRLQPRECMMVSSATPSFFWVAPSDRPAANPFTFTLNRGGTNAQVVQLTLSQPWVNLTSQLPNGKLPAGVYYWTLMYTNSQGTRKSSRVRYFQVPAYAAAVVLPSGAQLRDHVKVKGPRRMLPAGANFLAIASRAQSGEYQAAYNALMSDAKKAITLNAKGQFPAPPTPDQPAAAPKVWQQIGNERLLLEEIALAAQFTAVSNPTDSANYTKQGIAHLKALAQWNPAGITSETNDDQANREMILSMAEGLDFFRDSLSAAEISPIVNAIHPRFCQILSADSTCTHLASFESWPNDSHKFTVVRYLTEALLHIAGMPYYGQTPDMLASVWEYYLNTINNYQTIDGSHGSGVAYGWDAIGNVATSVAAVRVIGDVDMSQQFPIRNFGWYLMSMTPANIFQMSPYGDGSEQMNLYQQGTWEAFKLYSALVGLPEYEWYWRVSHQNITLAAAPHMWNFMTLGMGPNGSAIPLATPAAPTGASQLFDDGGVVAMHSANINGSDLTTATADTNRSSVFFLSSRFGSYNHMQAAQNSFELVSHGQNMLINSGDYQLYGTPYFMNVTRATRYKNALTVDGGIGQAEPADPSTGLAPTVAGAPEDTMASSGQLINYAETGTTWAVATGDARNAYRYLAPDGTWQPLLTKVYRTVAYNRPEKTVVIYDYAESPVPRTWELNFHALGAFSNQNVNMIQINNAAGTLRACIDIANLAGSYKLSQGYDSQYQFTPTEWSKPQYHARYVSSAKSTRLVAVTIIREDCRSIARPVTPLSATSMQVQINGGTPITFDEQTLYIPN